MGAPRLAEWTDERVERLKKLFADGWSATQIAKDLGGITRNAAIGKLHRLGLRRGWSAGREASQFVKHQAALKREAKAPKPRAHPPGVPLPKERPHEGPVVELLYLGARHCRWPIGDPQESGFGFCGGEADGPYCDDHAQVAYQPPQAKKSSAAELRSLRRCI